MSYGVTQPAMRSIRSVGPGAAMDRGSARIRPLTPA
jgi:hypothetical protein